jgi:hypothetical protein
MEKLRIEPCIDACTTDTDRQVSLKDNPTGMRIVAYFRKLKVEMILDKTPEINI